MAKRICLEEDPDLSGFTYILLKDDKGVFLSKEGVVYNPFTKRLFTGGVNKQGYVSTSVFGKRYFMHRLLATTFLPNPENHPQVNHKDMNRENNTLDNLEWCTNGQNVKHSYENNASRRVVLPGNSRPAKLLKSEVLSIVHLVGNSELSKSEIARKFNVSNKTIYQIMNGTVHRQFTGFTKEVT